MSSQLKPQNIPKVFFIGAGPGDPDLITLKGLKILQKANVVLYDALINDDILQHCQSAALYNVGKRCGKHSHSQAQINALLLQIIAEYTKNYIPDTASPIVVRLKGGDPCIFARLQEEIDLLTEANICFEIIPGVTAASAAAAALNISLTQRGVSRAVRLLTLATGKENNTDNMHTQEQDTFVFYMGKHQIKNIEKYLNIQGINDNSYIYLIENVSLNNQRIYTTTFSQLYNAESYTRMLAWISQEEPLLIIVKK